LAAANDMTTNFVTVLTKQRDGLVQKVGRMQAMTAKGERVR
jgi:hypothetical protein